jgi:serine/threonine protein kinase
LPHVVEAVGHIARTLADLAAEGVLHRDIKPENLFKLDGEWVIGDFGLVKYPEQEAVTRHGQRLGPSYFMAPEMRRNADTADAELADVYSLAKTLWAIAARSDPPPGQLRRDTSTLQHSRAKLLEPLLERCTADNPRERPRLHELAEELSWWAEPTVSTQADLSRYAIEVQRLRNTTRVVKKETEQERLERLYNEAFQRVQLDLVGHLSGAMEQAGLVRIGFETRTLDGWPPENYGGGANLSRWGIEMLSSPWLATSIGVVHRAQPEADL